MSDISDHFPSKMSIQTKLFDTDKKAGTVGFSGKARLGGGRT